MSAERDGDYAGRVEAFARRVVGRPKKPVSEPVEAPKVIPEIAHRDTLTIEGETNPQVIGALPNGSQLTRVTTEKGYALYYVGTAEDVTAQQAYELQTAIEAQGRQWAHEPFDKARGMQLDWSEYSLQIGKVRQELANLSSANPISTLNLGERLDGLRRRETDLLVQQSAMKYADYFRHKDLESVYHRQGLRNEAAYRQAAKPFPASDGSNPFGL